MLTRSRLRFVLEALEDHQRGPKTEDQHVTRGKLTIEQSLSRSWRKRWPPPKGEDTTRAEIERDRLLHTIGNLTLVTASLNPALSNDPWEEKQEALANHTVLLLNKKQLDGGSDNWSETEILERADTLANAAIEIWPRR